MSLGYHLNTLESRVRVLWAHLGTTEQQLTRAAAGAEDIALATELESTLYKTVVERLSKLYSSLELVRLGLQRAEHQLQRERLLARSSRGVPLDQRYRVQSKNAQLDAEEERIHQVGEELGKIEQRCRHLLQQAGRGPGPTASDAISQAADLLGIKDLGELQAIAEQAGLPPGQIRFDPKPGGGFVVAIALILFAVTKLQRLLQQSKKEDQSQK